nr:hypothetical protein CFP56_07976 [Quercus suber]
MDCVRQKYQGGVVGHVKTLERISTIQPPSRDPRVQQQTVSQNFGNLQPAQEPLFVPQPSISAAPPARAAPPVFVAPPVPESRGIVEPPQSIAQAQDLSQAEVRVQETPQISSLPPSISPLDFEGKDSKYDPPEEISSVDVIDHSDIFIPGATPYIPEKSPQRSPQLSEAFPARMPEPQRVTPPGVQHKQAISIPEPSQQSGMASPQSPNTPQSPNASQSRRSNVAPLLRSLSDSSLSELSKSYARPSMSPVPENEGLPDEDRNPARYSYKGEIPAADGPMPGARLPPPPIIGVRAASPQKPNLNGHLPSSQLNGAQYLSIVGAGSRRSVPAAAPGLKPNLSVRNSYTQPLKPSPLSSQENSPPDSEVSTSDDGRHVQPMAPRPSMGPRLPSNSTVASTNTAAGKPRTYFTHAGRVTVAPGEQTSTEPTYVSVPPKAEPVAPIAEKNAGKKKRFSIRLGRKS